jgi:hypothetical protein
MSAFNATFAVRERALAFTPATAGSVEELITALLQGVPFLTPQAPAAADDVSQQPAWFATAAWPMTPPRSAAVGTA